MIDVRPWAVTVKVLATLPVVAVALSGCGQPSPSSAVAAAVTSASALAVSPSASAPAPTLGNPANNQRAAQAEADRLVALAVLPANAVSTTVPPSSVAGRLPGQGDAGSQIFRSRAWRVALPFDQTLAWLKAHPPTGLTASGGTSSYGTEVRTAGTIYTEPNTPAWTGAQLQFGASAITATTTLIRADAHLAWLDPTPSRDLLPGPRLRVTLTSGCPASDQAAIGVTNPGNAAALSASLIPPGTPTAGLLCRYVGLNPDPGTPGQPMSLNRSTHLDPTAATRIAAALAQIPLSHTNGGGIIHCPRDDGAATIIVLTYPATPDVDVWLHRTGCSTTSNGYITAGTADLQAAIAAAES